MKKNLKDKKSLNIAMLGHKRIPSREGGILELVKEQLIWKETQLENSLQPPLKAPFPKPENREKFWRDFRTQPFGYIAKEYGGIGLKNNTKVFLKKVKRKIKRLVVKGGKRDSRTI